MPFSGCSPIPLESPQHTHSTPTVHPQYTHSTPTAHPQYTHSTPTPHLVLDDRGQIADKVLVQVEEAGEEAAALGTVEEGGAESGLQGIKKCEQTV